MMSNQLHAICGDLIKLYSSKDIWGPNFYLLGSKLSMEDRKERVKYFLFENYYLKFILSNNYYKKTYRYLESYLATYFIKRFLEKNLGFLEGNFLFINPRKNKSFLPNLEFPLEFFKLLDICPGEYISVFDIAFRYFQNEQILFNEVQNIILIDEYFFPDIVGNNRKQLKKILLKWIEVVLTEKSINKHTSKIFQEIKSLVRNIDINFNSLIRELNITSIANRKDIEITWSDYVENRLLEDILNLAKSQKIAVWRETPSDFNERTEFLKFLKFNAPVTDIEKLTNTLWVEDGEISVLILEYHLATHNSYQGFMINKNDELINPLSLDGLKYMGFIDDLGNYYKVSDRAKRMARWIQKFFGIKTFKELHLIYSDLLKGEAWSWLYEIGQGNERRKIIEDKTQILINSNNPLEAKIIIDLFEEFVNAIFPFKCNNRIIRSREDIIASTPVNIPINNFLRKYETTARDLFSFSVTGMPSEDEERSIGVFTGTCSFGDEIDGNSLNEFYLRREKILEKIQNLKIFLTTIGWPGLQLILEKEARENEEANVNAFLSHAFKRPATRANQIIESLDYLPHNIDLRKYLKNELQAPIEEILKLTRLFGFITTSAERKCSVKILNKKQKNHSVEFLIIKKFLEVIEYITLKGKQSDRDKIKKWFDESKSKGIPIEKYLIETNIICVIPKDLKLEFLFNEEDKKINESLDYNYEKDDISETPDIILWDLIFPELLTNAIKYSDRFDPRVIVSVRVQHENKKLYLSVYNNGKYLDKIEYEKPGRFKAGQDRRHLGIALNKRAAKLLCWEIEPIETEDIKATGQGGCVSLSIPIFN